MREIQDLFDFLPYCLLVALPIMIILSPTAQAIGHEFPAHRLAQFELGGVARGSKTAALSMDARSVPSEANVNLLRKTIVARIKGIFFNLYIKISYRGLPELVCGHCIFS